MDIPSGYKQLNWTSTYAEAARKAKSLSSEFGCDIHIQPVSDGWEVWVPQPVYRDIQQEIYDRELDQGY